MRWQPHNPVSGIFDMVRVIAMSQHADRRREFSAQLRRLGLSPEVLPDLVHEAVAPEHPSGIRPLGPGARLQAHRDVVDAFLASGRGSLLLIQDDAVFPGAERGRIPAVLLSLSQQRWDLFFGEAPGLAAGRLPVSFLAPDGSAGQCQVVGLSRAAAIELAVFLRGWPRAIRRVTPSRWKMPTRPFDGRSRCSPAWPPRRAWLRGAVRPARPLQRRARP
ncbi:hypothetical protein LUX29_15740 [Aureimonas altamirensis]|uniref:hypothetical protein n=1 Tax=Aureimonas altamirensis TaxID=370622 RepID=UPI001E5436CD|nr:hypothetical protein [Aureimonas altamirensis]UHD44491.1 hypothetical protein LUX29_15740 [Aureimonas altamirensis]